MNNAFSSSLDSRAWLKLVLPIMLLALGGYFFGAKILLTLVAFFAASVANATAIGGGFLFMPLFIFVYQLAPPLALKLSIATQAFGMTSGALSWGRNYIDKHAFILASIASITGVWFATYLWIVPSSLIKPLFAIISLGVFFALIVEMRLKGYSEHTAAKFSVNRVSVFFVLSAFAGGLVTAWTAIGVGEVVALYLLFFYRLRLDIAIGTGVAVLAVSSIAGFIFHTDLGGIPWDLLLFTVPGVILGGRYGVKVAKYLESTVSQSSSDQLLKKSPLKLIFAVVILIDCIVILLSEFLL
ncbi:MAG: sulfite exporter TauE/SafE family protein [Porticoccaceae bacterium]